MEVKREICFEKRVYHVIFSTGAQGIYRGLKPVDVQKIAMPTQAIFKADYICDITGLDSDRYEIVKDRRGPGHLPYPPLADDIDDAWLQEQGITRAIIKNVTSPFVKSSSEFFNKMINEMNNSSEKLTLKILDMEPLKFNTYAHHISNDLKSKLSCLLCDHERSFT